MFCGPLGNSGCQKVQLVRLRDLDAVDKQKVGQSVGMPIKPEWPWVTRRLPLQRYRPRS